jgi:acyl-CoA thioester hydrolase
MSKFIWPVRVYYEDTDAVGTVYHANYLGFMERARSEWLRELGFAPVKLKQAHNLVFVIKNVHIDYLKPAWFDDQLQISVQITELKRASVIVAQKVLRDNEVLSQATVRIAMINLTNLRPAPFPAALFQALQPLIAHE